MKTSTLTFVKSTKNTHVYATDDTDAPVGQLYVKKSGLPAEPPKVIVVTVQWED